MTATHIAAVAFVVALSTPVVADESIGNATAITTAVTGAIGDNIATLNDGDAVFHDEVIATDENGVGQFKFRDQTQLAVGPGSSIVLDDFVYDSNTSAGHVVIELTRGTLRFATGKANHDAYEIITPTATIGVRGTIFDLYATPSGELAVAMIDGAIDVCPTGRPCFRHDVIGKFLHMSRDGIFALRDHWDGSFLTGVTLSTAMPFLVAQEKLVPTLRGKTATVSRYLSAAGDVIKKPLLTVPKLKLPKLFK